MTLRIMRNTTFLSDLGARLCLVGLLVGVVSLQAQADPGKSLTFNAPGARLTIKPISLPPPWTVELWVKRQNSPAVSAPLFVNSISALKLEQYSTPRSVGFTRFGVEDYSFNYTAPLNEWVHLAFVASPSGICLLTNGVLQSCVSATIPLPLDFFGTTPLSFTDIFRGEVDEIRVWQGERKPADIVAAMRYHLLGTEPGLVGYWSGDDSSPNLAANRAIGSSLPAAQLTAVTRQVSTVPFAPDDGNTAPQFGLLPARSTYQDQPLQFTVDVIDPEQTHLALSATSGNTAVIPSDSEHLRITGEGVTRTLRVVPLRGMSGIVPINLQLTDGFVTTRAQFLIHVIPAPSPRTVELTSIEPLPGSRVRLAFRTSLNSNAVYAVEQTEELADAVQWAGTPSSLPVSLGGQRLAVEVPVSRPIGFFRIRGLEPIHGSFGAASFAVSEDAGEVRPVVVFDAPYQGLLRYTWSYERPDGLVTNFTAALQVDGNTAAIPVPIEDNDQWDTVRSIRLTIEPGTGFQPGARITTRLDLVDNDTQWAGRIQNRLFSDKLMLSLVSSGSGVKATLIGDGHGFLPVGRWDAPATSTPSLFRSSFGPIAVPASQSYVHESFQILLSLRAETGQAGQLVSPDAIQGSVEWVFQFPNRPHLNSTNSGTFALLRTPPAPPANLVQLSPLR